MAAQLLEQAYGRQIMDLSNGQMGWTDLLTLGKTQIQVLRYRRTFYPLSALTTVRNNLKRIERVVCRVAVTKGACLAKAQLDFWICKGGERPNWPDDGGSGGDPSGPFYTGGF